MMRSPQAAGCATADRAGLHLWVKCASATVVRVHAAGAAQLTALLPALPPLLQVRIAVVGGGTAEILDAAGLKPEFVASKVS